MVPAGRRRPGRSGHRRGHGGVVDAAVAVRGARARRRAGPPRGVQNPILPIYRHREVGFIARQSRMQTIVVPGVFRGFDFPPMVEEATAGRDVDIIVADPDLPEGDPARCRPTARHRPSCAGCSTRPARPPTRRGPSTATAACRRRTTACSGAWRSPRPTRRRSCSRSPTSAASCGSSTRCRRAPSC